MSTIVENLDNSENKGEIIIYEAKDGELAIDVKLENETVWLSQKQMAKLFNKSNVTIFEHIKNIFEEGELTKDSTIRKFRTVQNEGGREVSRDLDFYNLDVIISVGYRVKSKEGTRFRIWSTKILKDHILKGFTVNQKRLKDKGLLEFEKTLALVKKAIDNNKLDNDQTDGLLKIITDYANSWLLLQKYDEDKLDLKNLAKAKYKLEYKEAKEVILKLKEQILKDASGQKLFGLEREAMLESTLGTLYQTFGGDELYSSIEEKAAHLLYFVIKDHPFFDGNKRIGAFLFILFLDRNSYLLKANQEVKINDNALVALALLIAESDPKQKDVMIKLIMNFVTGKS